MGSGLAASIAGGGLWGRVKKSCKIGQGQEALISASA